MPVGRRLLPLQGVPHLVGRPGQRLHAWKPEAVKVTQGEDKIGEYNANERSYRQWCTVCGGHLMTRIRSGPGRRLRCDDPDFPFEPGVHVNYE